MRVEHHEINGCPVTVVHLWTDSVECAMCGAECPHKWSVPWYCGPAPEGCSDSGYRAVCKGCHDMWAAADEFSRYYGA